jgi:hypothetical protein
MSTGTLMTFGSSMPEPRSHVETGIAVIVAASAAGVVKPVREAWTCGVSAAGLEKLLADCRLRGRMARSAGAARMSARVKQDAKNARRATQDVRRCLFMAVQWTAMRVPPSGVTPGYVRRSGDGGVAPAACARIGRRTLDPISPPRYGHGPASAWNPSSLEPEVERQRRGRNEGERP